MPDLGEHFQTVPITQEFVTVDKVAAQTDAVRIHTSVEETEVVVEESVHREALNVRRVRMDLPVDVAPLPREEGDTTIISLVEERLVVEKRLFVVEEIHVTREQTRERVAIPVTLRATHATVERPSQTPTTGNTNDG